MKFIKIVCILILSSILAHAAIPITLNKTINGSLHNGVKYYIFTLNRATYVTVNVAKNNSGSILLQKNGSYVDYSQRYGKEPLKIDTLLSSGTYTIKISGMITNFLLHVYATLEVIKGGGIYSSNPEDNPKYNPQNAHNARKDFLSNVTQVLTEDFESYDVHNGIVGLGFAVLDPGAGIGNRSGNTPISFSGGKYMSGGSSNISIHFNKPISAFGFYVSNYEYAAGLYLKLTYASGEVRKLSVPRGGTRIYYFSIIERDSNKAITSVQFYNTDGDSCSWFCADFKYDDISIAESGHLKNYYEDIDDVPNRNDPFLDSSHIWVDTDNDGIEDKVDSDDDNDGISDVVERKYKMNPLNAFDAQEDFDHDGFSNAIEISMGTNIRSASSKPTWAPILIDNIMTFIPAKY